MKIEKEIKKITTINELIQIVTILDKYYKEKREIINNIYEKYENLQLKEIHEKTDTAILNLVDKYQLDNLLLKTNNELSINQLNLIENMQEFNKIEIVKELYDLNNYYLGEFSEFKINIHNEYDIIIDYEKKKIYNIDYNDLNEIFNRLNLFDIVEGDFHLKIILLNWIHENTIQYYHNNKYEIDFNNLKLDNCISYNKNDPLIVYNINNNSFYSTEEVNLTNGDYKEIIDNIIYDSELINIILNNI